MDATYLTGDLCVVVYFDNDIKHLSFSLFLVKISLSELAGRATAKPFECFREQVHIPVPEIVRYSFNGLISLYQTALSLEFQQVVDPVFWRMS